MWGIFDDSFPTIRTGAGELRHPFEGFDAENRFVKCDGVFQAFFGLRSADSAKELVHEFAGVRHALSSHILLATTRC